MNTTLIDPPEVIKNPAPDAKFAIIDETFDKVVRPLLVYCTREIEKADKHMLTAKLESLTALSPDGFVGPYKKLKENLENANEEKDKKNIEVEIEKFETAHKKKVGNITIFKKGEITIMSDSPNIFKSDGNYEFSGKTTSRGEPHFGREILKDGTKTQTFYGKFKDGKRDIGVVTFIDNSLYIGDFTDNKIKGYGCYQQIVDGITYFTFANFDKKEPQIVFSINTKTNVNDVIYQQNDGKSFDFSGDHKKELFNFFSKLSPKIGNVLNELTARHTVPHGFGLHPYTADKIAYYGLIGAAVAGLGALGYYVYKKMRKSKKSPPKVEAIEDSKKGSDAEANNGSVTDQDVPVAQPVVEAVVSNDVKEVVDAQAVGDAESVKAEVEVKSVKRRGRPPGKNTRKASGKGSGKRSGKGSGKGSTKRVPSGSSTGTRESARIKQNNLGSRQSARIKEKKEQKK
jgi:hypothetical protein